MDKEIILNYLENKLKSYTELVEHINNRLEELNQSPDGHEGSTYSIQYRIKTVQKIRFINELIKEQKKPSLTTILNRLEKVKNYLGEN